MFNTEIAKDKDRDATIKFCNDVLTNFFSDKEVKKLIKKYNSSEDKKVFLMQLRTKLLKLTNTKIDNNNVEISSEKMNIDLDFVLGEFTGAEHITTLLKEKRTQITKNDFQNAADKLKTAKDKSIQNVRNKLGPLYAELELNMMKKGIAAIYKSEELKGQIKDSLKMLEAIIEGQELGKERQKSLNKELAFLAFHIVMSTVIPFIGVAVKDAIKEALEKSMAALPDDVNSEVAEAIKKLQTAVALPSEVGPEGAQGTLERLIGSIQFMVERAAVEKEFEVHLEEESEEEGIEKKGKKIKEESLKALQGAHKQLLDEFSKNQLNMDNLLGKLLKFSEVCIELAVKTTISESKLTQKIDINIENYKNQISKITDISTIETIEKDFVRNIRKSNKKILKQTEDDLFLKNITTLVNNPNGSSTLLLKTTTDYMTLFNPETDSIAQGVSGGKPLPSKISPKVGELFMKYSLTPNNPKENVYTVRHLYGTESKTKFVEGLPELQLLPAFRGKRVLMSNSAFGYYIDRTGHLYADQINSVEYRNQRHMTWISLKQIFDSIKEFGGNNIFYQFDKSKAEEATSIIRSLIKKDMLMQNEINEKHPLYSKKKPHVLGPLYLLFVLPQFSSIVNNNKFLNELAKVITPQELEHFNKIADMVKEDYQLPKTLSYERFSVWAKAQVTTHQNVMKEFAQQQSANKDPEKFKTDVEVLSLNMPRDRHTKKLDMEKKSKDRGPTSTKDKHHVSPERLNEIIKNYEKREKVAEKTQHIEKSLSAKLIKLENNIEYVARDISILNSLQKKYSKDRNATDKSSFEEINDDAGSLKDILKELSQNKDLKEQLKTIQQNKTISYADKQKLLDCIIQERGIGGKFIKKIREKVIESLQTNKKVLNDLADNKEFAANKKDIKAIKNNIDELLKSLIKEENNPSVLLINQLSEIDNWLKQIKQGSRVNEFLQHKTYTNLTKLVSKLNSEENSQPYDSLEEMKNETIGEIKDHLESLNKKLIKHKELPEATITQKFKNRTSFHLESTKKILEEELDYLQKLLNETLEEKLNLEDKTKLADVSKKIEALKAEINVIKSTETISSIINDIKILAITVETINGKVVHTPSKAEKNTLLDEDQLSESSSFDISG